MNATHRMAARAALVGATIAALGTRWHTLIRSPISIAA